MVIRLVLVVSLFGAVLVPHLTADAQDRGVKLSGKEMASERRVALVIGNGAYSDGRLKNPVNDAKAVSRALKSVGFKVIERHNLDDKAMKRVIREFGAELKKGGVGLFYFAGHGMQVNGRNFLIPVNAKIEVESDVEIEGVDVGRVLARMEAARNRLNLVVLDACRNNPFARSFRSSNKGLAFSQAPRGTLIAYATAPGSVAADGSGRNGTYTGAFVKHITTPGSKVEDVFKAIRIDVQRETKDRQTPWESSSLTGDFYFTLPKENAVTKAPRVECPEGSSWNGRVCVANTTTTSGCPEGTAWDMNQGACVKVVAIKGEKIVGKVPAQPCPKGPVAWRCDGDAALAHAKATNKPAFVFFRASWSNPGVDFERNLLVHPDVVGKLDKVVPIWVDLTKGWSGSSLAKKYGIKKVPTTLVFDRSGKLSTKFIGAKRSKDDELDRHRIALDKVIGTGGPSSAKELYDAGRRELSAGNRDSALGLFRKAADKGYSTAWKLMGNIYLQKGQTGKAKSCYERYLRLRPNAADADAIRATIIRLGN